MTVGTTARMMRSASLSFVLIVTWLLIAPMVRSEEATSALSPQLKTYLVGADHRRAISEKISPMFFQRYLYCKGIDDAIMVNVNILAPLEFGSDGVPINGAWKETIDIKGCSQTVRVNVAAIATPDEPLQLVSLLAGTTLASPILQRDALPHAQIAGIRDPSRFLMDPNAPCVKSPPVIDTKFDGFVGEAVADALHGPSARPWKETWTIKGCSKLIDVPMYFIPDNTGTTIRAAITDAVIR